MAKFEKGNQLWKKSPEFKKHIGNWTPESVGTPEFKEKKRKGQERYKAINRLKKDIFNDMVGDKDLNIHQGVKRVLHDAIVEGNTKQFVDLLKLITPKELDITSDGKAVNMGTVVLNGKELDLDIGEEVKEKEEE